jgi:hypothetical protein
MMIMNSQCGMDGKNLVDHCASGFIQNQITGNKLPDKLPTTEM